MYNCYSNAFHNTNYCVFLAKGVWHLPWCVATMEDCKGRREFEGVARLKPACLSAKHGETFRFLEFLNAFFPTPVGFLAMALPPPSPVSPPVPLHPPNLNQTDRNRSEPTGTDRNRPESRPKLRSRHLVFSFFKANLPSMNRPRSAHVGRLGRVAGVLAGALWGLSIEGAALSLRASLSRPWDSKINRFIQFENWLINPCFLILPLCKLIYITVIMCFMLLFSSFCWMLFHLNLGGQEKSEANLNELILPQRA